MHGINHQRFLQKRRGHLEKNYMIQAQSTAQAVSRRLARGITASQLLQKRARSWHGVYIEV